MSDETDRLERHPTDDLAALALGALDADEARGVESHVARCDTCAAELAAHREALFAVALAATREPPADLRSKILLRHRGAADRSAKDASRAGARAPARAATSGYEWLRAFFARPVPLAVPLALVVLLVAAVAIVGQTRSDADAYAQALAGVADGRVVTLAPTPEAPEARGALVIPSQGSAYLVLRLPAPPAGKTWEAWVLRGQSAIPAGTSDGHGVFTLRLGQSLLPGDGAAVSLENAPGVDKPTTVVLAVQKT